MTPNELALPVEPEVGTRWRGQDRDWKRVADGPEGWAAGFRDEIPRVPAWTFGAALSFDGPFAAIEDGVTP